MVAFACIVQHVIRFFIFVSLNQMLWRPSPAPLFFFKLFHLLFSLETLIGLLKIYFITISEMGLDEMSCLNPLTKSLTLSYI